MKKAGLQTGVRGVSLIETLLAVTILSSGIIFIAPALFRSGGVLAHLGHQYEAELLANNLMAEKEEDARKLRQLDSRTFRGEVQSQGVVYSYQMETSKEDSAGRLHLLTIRVNWRDYKAGEVLRSAYILK